MVNHYGPFLINSLCLYGTLKMFFLIISRWREADTEAEVIVDPIFVHLNLAYFIFGGNFVPRL